MKYIIKDWAGNILTYDGLFDSPQFAMPMLFEDADDALEYTSNLTITDDLYVVEYETEDT
jgi:hypothetical protein